MSIYEVEISTTKFVEVEANTEEEAKQTVSEMPLSIEDFDWDFQAEPKFVKGSDDDE